MWSRLLLSSGFWYVLDNKNRLLLSFASGHQKLSTVHCLIRCLYYMIQLMSLLTVCYCDQGLCCQFHMIIRSPRSDLLQNTSLFIFMWKKHLIVTWLHQATSTFFIFLNLLFDFPTTTFAKSLEQQIVNDHFEKRKAGANPIKINFVLKQKDWISSKFHDH